MRVPEFMRSVSVRGRIKIARWTVLGTVGCMAIAIAINAFLFREIDGQAYRLGILSAAFIPIVLAGPLFFYLTLKLRELAIANHRIAMAASIDSLTTLLNRGAFVAAADARMESTGNRRSAAGAFLMIDADHFKAINDRYGHSAGDDALRIIAEAIRGSVRKDDLVGRLGGEEFGVFLPGAGDDAAGLVAERIRVVVSEIDFAPGGVPHRLTVSIGGVGFDYWRDGRVPTLGDLMRLADERLYAAKRAGRNRVSFVALAQASHGAAVQGSVH